jgi:hypothetical protein
MPVASAIARAARRTEGRWGSSVPEDGHFKQPCVSKSPGGFARQARWLPPLEHNHHRRPICSKPFPRSLPLQSPLV